MKRIIELTFAILSLGICGLVSGQVPVIAPFSGNGLLTCSNIPPGGVASIEWAPSLAGPWTNAWSGLDTISPDSNGVIQVSVPMYYRVLVRSTPTNPAPAGMALIPAGSFVMGNCMSEAEGWPDELPLHTVYVSGFYMDTTEITETRWDEVYQWALNHGYQFDNPGSGKETNHPVQTIYWYDAVKWCNARSEKEGLTPAYYTTAAQTSVYRWGQLDLTDACVKWAAGYRLPTEAEWEKAARGGAAGHRFPWTDVDTISQSRANYCAISNRTYDLSYPGSWSPEFAVDFYPYTSPVGHYAPNGYGLYDMAGNVVEWCWDWYDSTYYSHSPETDPHGPAEVSDFRVLRGGSWDWPVNDTRCSFRLDGIPLDWTEFYIGLRCVRGL